MTYIGRIWFILAYCHSYWQNMQPINSVLPFCSALPIQYTTHSIAFRATMKFTKGWFQRTDMVCIYSLMECNASRSRFFVIFVVTSERRAIIRHFAKYIDNYSTVNNLLLRAVYCRHVIKLGCEVVPLPESACQSSVLFIGPWFWLWALGCVKVYLLFDRKSSFGVLTVLFLFLCCRCSLWLLYTLHFCLKIATVFLTAPPTCIISCVLAWL